MLAMYGVSVANAFSILDEDEREAVLASPVQDSTPSPVEVPVKEKRHEDNRRSNQRHPRRGVQEDNQRPRRSDNDDENKQNRRPKREFDRRSGTGRDPDVKRQGKGARNWGSAPSDAKEAKSEETAFAASSSWDSAPASTAAELTSEQAGVSWGVTNENIAPEAEGQYNAEPTPEPEPEQIQLDLEEYLKNQASLRVDDDTSLQIRKVDRDDNEKILVSAPEEDVSGLFESGEKKKKSKAKQAGKKILNIAEFTKDQQKPQQGGFRGGRRGGRGGSFGGRGGSFSGRGGRRGDDERQKNKSQVDIADKLAFPSLA